MMEVVILRHKKMKDYTGKVKSGVLYRVGDGVTPQLFPSYTTVEWICLSIKYTDKFAGSINDYELVKAELTIME